MDYIKIHSPSLSDEEVKYVQMFMKDNKLKAIFNLYGFLFGWFYLLYKKAYLESLAVIIISLLLVQIGFILHSYLFLLLGLITPNLLVGFYFYFMLANKIDRDIEHCNQPIDKQCLAKRGGNSIAAALFGVFMVIFLFWPVIYAKITHQDVTTKQDQYINKVEKALH
ncbi:MAG: dihydroorotase [Epsilonproteobacteria bacterium]|nr:dihydroorotase [Campylobacterota bacterium]